MLAKYLAYLVRNMPCCQLPKLESLAAVGGPGWGRGCPQGWRARARASAGAARPPTAAEAGAVAATLARLWVSPSTSQRCPFYNKGGIRNVV